MNERTPKLLAWSFPDADSLNSAAEHCAADPSVKELLPIRTCQRCELFALIGNENPIRFDHAEHSCEGSDAVTRLFAIAAGALSDIPGERAVANQIRGQLRLALKRRRAGTVLAKLTRRALASGETLRERVQETTPILELADLVTHLVANLQSRGRLPALPTCSIVASRDEFHWRFPIPFREGARGWVERTNTTQCPTHPSTPSLKGGGVWLPAAAGAAGITVLGAGVVGRSIHNAMTHAGFSIHLWGTRHPRSDANGPSVTIDEALQSIPDNSILIAALGEGASPIRGDQLPSTITVIDLSVPSVVHGASLTLRDIIDQSRDLLQPQRDAVERAAHRLKARAEAALAETLCPAMKAINESIARFRQAIIDAEYRRLAPSFATMPPEEVERVRRSIRHTAARCVHPIHEYVNTLGRQGRVDEARTVVDHLLGTRVGVLIEDETEAVRESPGIAIPGL